MKNYYDQVRYILNKYPKARDDDYLLWAIFLFMNNIVKEEEKFYEVITKAKANKLPSYESITRARRKVQEKEPNLRGKAYAQRKKEEATYHDFYRDN